MHFISDRNNNHNTRQINNFQMTHARTNICKKGFWYFGPFLWNKLPLHLKNAINLYLFKKNLGEFITTL